MAVTNPILASIEKSAAAALGNALPPRLISADSHVTEPPHCYIDRIDPAFRDRAPKVVRDADGGDVFVIDGMASAVPLGIVAAAGKDPREIRKSECRVEDLHRGGWDGKARVADQERDGIAAEIIYPTVGMMLCNHADFDYKKVVATVTPFMTGDCSAFYFDIRKDALYCEAPSSHLRKSALTVVDVICDAVLKWLAPILVFTTDEAWAMYRPGGAPSVHLEIFPEGLAQYRDDALAERWKKIRRVRSVVTGALEIERANKAIGSSLEAAPVVFISDVQLREAVEGVDMAEVCITSAIMIQPTGDTPEGAFVLADVPGVAVVPSRAEGRKCARSWKISPLVGSDPEFPDVTPRDAAALRELKALGKWAAA